MEVLRSTVELPRFLHELKPSALRWVPSSHSLVMSPTIFRELEVDSEAVITVQKFAVGAQQTLSCASTYPLSFSIQLC